MTINLLNLSSLSVRIRLAVLSLCAVLLPAVAIAQADIATNPSSTYLYPGNTYSASFSGSNFTPASGNVYMLQLSDAYGGFSSPTTLGSQSSTSTSGTISFQLSANIQSGYSYRLRTVSSSPAVTGTGTGSVFINAPAISAPSLGSSSFVAGASFTAGCSNNGYLPASGNVYTLQLSDAFGSFANPTVLGTQYVSSNATTIYAAIPAGTPAGTGYIMRCTGSNPSVTGSNSGNLTIVAPTITSNPSTTSLYPGNTYSVSFSGSNFTPASGNVYTVQLSDPYSSFSNPTTLGSQSSTATSGTISFLLSSNFPSGYSYKLRTVSSSPAVTGTATGSVSINAPAISAPSLSSSTFTAGAAFNAGCSTNGYQAASGNVFTLQLSDASGSFANPTVLASQSATGTATYIYANIPASTPTGTGYKMRFTGSNPSVTGSTSGNITINGPSITTTPSSSSLYPGNSYAVSFSSSIFTPNAGNSYTVQLSNATGSFTSPVTIGSLSSTATSGTIMVMIPTGATPGTGYRMRTLSSNPAVTGADNGADITINQSLNGLAFDGTDDNVVLPATNNLPTGNSPYTLEAWIKPTTMGTYGIIGWGPWGTGNAVNALRLSPSGIINYWWGNDLVTTTANLAGAWHHVAATYDGKTRIIYLDGAIAGQDVPTVNTHAVPNATNARIGNTNNGEYFSGGIDEVRVWNRALCQAELQNNMNGILPSPTEQTGLVAYYKMDQGSAGGTNTGITTLTDASSSGSNGTLSGFTYTGTTSNYVTGTTAITGNAAPYAPTTPVTNNEAISKTINGATGFTGCGPLGVVTPNGAAPVNGSVTFKETYDAIVQSYSNHAYVQRHYDIEPATNAASATANITLYYTQADFDAYNAANGTDPDLPTTANSTDPNIGNLSINQYHGTGTTPGTYTGTGTLITPTSVLYQNGRWEVTFPVTGFSGFFVSGNLNQPLPVTLASFTAVADGQHNRVDWKMGEEFSGTAFAITRSGNGSTFETIGHVDGTGTGSYTFYDAQPLSGVNYYRLAFTAPGTDVAYSNIAIVRRMVSGGSITVAPVPASTNITITNTDATLTGATATVVDMQGREVYRFVIGNSQTVDVHSWAAGIYMLRLPTGEVVRMVRE